MGQVFTWDAVRRGHIPKPESFGRVAQLLRERLAAEPSVVCALMFGSVLRGDSNFRSDIDCIVLYELEDQDRALCAMRELDCAAKALFVPINFTPCDTVVAKTPHHAVSESFRWHLDTSVENGGLIKGSLDILAKTAPAKFDIEQYVSRKMYNLTEGRAHMTTYSDEHLAGFLKKAIEMPMHIARKMLVYEHKLIGDSKREVVEQYARVMPHDLAAKLSRLVEHDAWYTRQLTRLMDKPEEAVFGMVHRELLSVLPEIDFFVRENLLRLK